MIAVAAPSANWAPKHPRRRLVLPDKATTDALIQAHHRATAAVKAISADIQAGWSIARFPHTDDVVVDWPRRHHQIRFIPGPKAGALRMNPGSRTRPCCRRTSSAGTRAEERAGEAAGPSCIGWIRSA